MTLKNTPIEKTDAILAAQKAFFRSGKTLDLAFRKAQLKKLLSVMQEYEQELADALWTDLHKSREEAYLTELSIVKGEIREHLRKVRRWASKEHRKSPITIFGSRSYVVKEPLGSALIVSPWNYPVQLLLNPLVGAISAGCTAVLKPSPYVPNVSLVIQKMIGETFPEDYIAVVQGNREVNAHLFGMKFDLIFFTGSPALARKVAAAAAVNLVPMVLELGGKSPCIISKEADISLAAKRVAWGKTINSGQTCIAPDYILIHKDVKDRFVEEFGKCITELHGENVQKSPHFARMVTDAAFERVSAYLSEGKVLLGGHSDATDRYIEPTLLDCTAPDSPVINEEIFGPVFPVITLDGDRQGFIDEIADYVTEREKPLALYYFGKEQDGWEVIRRTSSGGGCINDTVMHIANPNIPFGGVGNSGMGHYHGKDSFDAFTHKRSIVVSPTIFDLPFRYMPYKLFWLIQKLLK